MPWPRSIYFFKGMSSTQRIPSPRARTGETEAGASAQVHRTRKGQSGLERGCQMLSTLQRTAPLPIGALFLRTECAPRCRSVAPEGQVMRSFCGRDRLQKLPLGLYWAQVTRSKRAGALSCPVSGICWDTFSMVRSGLGPSQGSSWTRRGMTASSTWY